MSSRIINTIGINENIPIVALDLQGNLVGHYESMNRCAKELGLLAKCISNTANKITLRTGKYLIFFESDYNPDIPVSYKGLVARKKFLNNRLSEDKITRKRL